MPAESISLVGQKELLKKLRQLSDVVDEAGAHRRAKLLVVRRQQQRGAAASDAGPRARDEELHVRHAGRKRGNRTAAGAVHGRDSAQARRIGPSQLEDFAVGGEAGSHDAGAAGDPGQPHYYLVRANAQSGETSRGTPSRVGAVTFSLDVP